MIIVFEDPFALDLEPITLTRATFELRCGAITHIDRIGRLAPERQIILLVRPQLAKVVAERFPDAQVNPPQIPAGTWLNGAAIWDESSFAAADQAGSRILESGRLMGGHFNADEGLHIRLALKGEMELDINPTTRTSPLLLSFLWDHVHRCGEQIKIDYNRWFANLDSVVEPENATVLGSGGLYIGPNVNIDPNVVLDIREGPIIIEEGSHIGANTVIEGPSYIGPNCSIWPRSLLQTVSLGPVCRVMGQVEHTIMQGYCNKQHDGFIGDAYLGEWVNLGAGTSNSNLKNNYSHVKVMVNGRLVDSAAQAVGLFMGDHSKSAIGTMFNTGTRVGVAANVFGAIRPERDIANFAWGDTGEKYDPEKCLALMALVKERRGKHLSDGEKELVRGLYEG